MAAALASGRTTRQPLSQLWAKTLTLLLRSGRGPFKATHQPCKGRPETEYLRPNLRTGTWLFDVAAPGLSQRAQANMNFALKANLNPERSPNPEPKPSPEPMPSPEPKPSPTLTLSPAPTLTPNPPPPPSPTP